MDLFKNRSGGPRRTRPAIDETRRRRARRAVWWPLAALLLLVGSTAVAIPTAGAANTQLPTPPQATTPPTTQAQVTVTTNLYAPLTAGSACSISGPPTSTFTQYSWDTYLTTLASFFHLANPSTAPISGLDIKFPLGCYYMNGTVQLDLHHVLTDDIIDGAPSSTWSNAPQFVETNTPACSGSTPPAAQPPQRRHQPGRDPGCRHRRQRPAERPVLRAERCGPHGGERALG